MPPAPPNPHMDGLAAQDFGLPMSACPHELNTDDGRLWRLGWLRGENWQRRIEGRMGEPQERWEEAQRMVAAECPPDPCQEVIDNLEELARGDHDDELAQGGTVPPVPAMLRAGTYTRLLVRPAGAPADAWRDLGAVRSFAFTDTPPSGKTDMLGSVLNDARKMMTRAAASISNDAVAASHAVAALVRCYGTDPPPDAAAAGHASDQLGRALPNPRPPAAKKRQPLCPSHGVELRGGGCPRCQREQQRRQNRRRR